MPTDADLLRRYVETHDEAAFGELVRRHLGFVYAAALRRTGGRAHLAEEVAQTVFCDLARKAAGLVRHPTLAGWLHRSTRYAAIDAVRAEGRRQKLARILTAMPDVTTPPALPADWEQLRPVLDEALDQLKDEDRELMLLRFFRGLTFAEAGAQLNLAEDAARRRTERALERLRAHLARRGVTSTAGAIGLLLANQPADATPAGLAASVTTAALASAPSGAAAGVFSLFTMSKFTAPLVSAFLAAGVTVLVWTTTANDLQPELAALRREHARLARATAADAPAAAVAAVADEFATQATAIGQAMAQRHAKGTGASTVSTAAQAAAPAASAVTARGHRNHGSATARDAALSFAWACDVTDPVELGKLVYFDPKVREQAEAVLATMPEGIRTQYPAPEQFYGMLLAAACIEAPPPGADLLEAYQVVELQPGRVAHRPPGSTRNNHEYQLTPDGWKYVLPEGGVKGLPNNLNSQTLAKLAKH